MLIHTCNSVWTKVIVLVLSISLSVHKMFCSEVKVISTIYMFCKGLCIHVYLTDTNISYDYLLALHHLTRSYYPLHLQVNNLTNSLKELLIGRKSCLCHIPLWLKYIVNYHTCGVVAYFHRFYNITSVWNYLYCLFYLACFYVVTMIAATDE